MKSINAFAAAAIVAAGLTGAASANAAPVGNGSADALVMQLQAQGNTVFVNRTGNHALGMCTVTNVRPGQSYSRYDSGYPGAQHDPMTQVVSMTVFVDAQC